MNGTAEPLTNGLNYRTAKTAARSTVNPTIREDYNFAQRQRISIGSYLDYVCEQEHYLNDDVKFSEDAPRFTKVICTNEGEFKYPSPWPPCVKSVQCPDPGGMLT